MAAIQCLSLSLACRFSALSLTPSAPSLSSRRQLNAAAGVTWNLGFSAANTNFLSTGVVAPTPVRRRRLSIVCNAAAATSTKKADSAAKRARQAEKRRIYNKARKSEIKTRMKKVLEELDALRKKPDAQPEEVLGIEKLIAEAYSAIDKAVKVGTLHRNTGARRKSRLARRKHAVEIHQGWFTPSPAA